MKIKPGTGYLAKLRAKFANGPIEINSSSENEGESETESEAETESDNEIANDEQLGDDEGESADVISISSDDDDVIMVESGGSRVSDQYEAMEVDDDRPLDCLLNSRQSSTDREVSADEIDLDNVRWASSSDDDDDSAVLLREPNPMIPGIIIFQISSKIYVL